MTRSRGVVLAAVAAIALAIVMLVAVTGTQARGGDHGRPGAHAANSLGHLRPAATARPTPLEGTLPTGTLPPPAVAVAPASATLAAFQQSVPAGYTETYKDASTRGTSTLTEAIFEDSQGHVIHLIKNQMSDSDAALAVSAFGGQLADASGNHWVRGGQFESAAMIRLDSRTLLTATSGYTPTATPSASTAPLSPSDDLNVLQAVQAAAS